MEDTEIALDVTIAADRLRGVAAISAFIGETPRRTYALLEAGELPGGKQRAIWVSSRRALRDHYRRLTSGGNGGG